jgi:RNA polymerase sigma-70 factor (ECF subfamily)
LRVVATILLSTTFVRAWKNLARLDSPAAFSGWLRQIALNVWLDFARRRNVRLGSIEDGDLADEGFSMDGGPAIDLERAMAALRPSERLCIVLALAEGMSHAEVARATGLPLGTVKSHIARGTAKLRTLLEPNE